MYHIVHQLVEIHTKKIHTRQPQVPREITGIAVLVRDEDFQQFIFTDVEE